MHPQLLVCHSQRIESTQFLVCVVFCSIFKIAFLIFSSYTKIVEENPLCQTTYQDKCRKNSEKINYKVIFFSGKIINSKFFFKNCSISHILLVGIVLLAELCPNCIIGRNWGYKSVPGDCTKFVQMLPDADGNALEFTHVCPWGQFWNLNHLTCQPSHEVYCADSE